LRLGGFDLVSLANNHSLDAGASGRAETLGTLNAAGIAGVVERNAGVLVSRGGPHPSLGYQLLALDDTVAPLDVEATGRAVAAAAQQAELVVVSVHWGGEYQAAPSPRQRAIARALAQAGADLVVGHGPHVLQPVEREGETLVAYSLGNLLFDQPYPADCRWGVILRVTCSASCEQLVVEFVPTVVERGRVRPAHAEERTAILARLTP
jgi:poly-gamma-glutamate synthesis protein (capsule biosynthesis protein)